MFQSQMASLGRLGKIQSGWDQKFAHEGKLRGRGRGICCFLLSSRFSARRYALSGAMPQALFLILHFEFKKGQWIIPINFANGCKLLACDWLVVAFN